MTKSKMFFQCLVHLPWGWRVLYGIVSEKGQLSGMGCAISEGSGAALVRAMRVEDRINVERGVRL